MVFGKQDENVNSVEAPFEHVREQRKWEKRNFWDYRASQGIMFSVKELMWPVTVHESRINMQNLIFVKGGQEEFSAYGNEYK